MPLNDNQKKLLREIPNQYNTVYFIRRMDTEVVKIGISSSPERRLSQLQSASEIPLELLGVIPTSYAEEALEIEHRLHKEFHSRKLNGEWFNLPLPVLMEVVARLALISYVYINTIAGRIRGKRGPAPRFGDEAVRQYSISITPKQAKELALLGEDNLSSGVRRVYNFFIANLEKP